jgi:hypothetical protein
MSPQSWAILEKLTVAQPLGNSQHFMEPENSLPRLLVPILSQRNPVDTSDHVSRIVFNLILPSMSKPSACSFLLFSQQYRVILSFSPIHATRRAHLTLPDLVIQIIFGEGYKFWSYSQCNFFPASIISYLLGQNLFLGRFSHTSSVCVLPVMWEASFNTHTKLEAESLLFDSRR